MAKRNGEVPTSARPPSLCETRLADHAVRMLALALIDVFDECMTRRGEGRVYFRAIMELVAHAPFRFASNSYTLYGVGFKDHERKRGKLVKCTAYFPTQNLTMRAG